MREETVRPQIVLFGDAITEQSFAPAGWGAALAQTFSRKADVLVRGYGGYNTRWALFLLNRLFPLNCDSAPSVTIISFGANDASLLGSDKMQHVPLDEYKDNLNKIVTHLKEASPSMAIVLVTPPPINEGYRKLLEKTNEMTGKYASKCAELAQEMNLQCVNLWSIMQQTASWQTLFFSDGSVLSKEGNEMVHREVVRALGGAGFCVANLRLDFPHFSEIDVIFPERAFRPDFEGPCSFNQEDQIPSPSFTQDGTVYQEPVLNDFDCFDDEEFLVEMVDPSFNQDESDVGPTYEPLLLPLPDDAFFPAPSPARLLHGRNSIGPTCQAGLVHESNSVGAAFQAGLLHESNSCGPTCQAGLLHERNSIEPTFQASVDNGFGSVQCNIKTEPVSLINSTSSVSILDKIKPPAQIKDPPAKTGPTPINPQQTLNQIKKSLKKKKAKKRSKKTCLHCASTRTPQWRNGPMGPSTLCNACGILYKKQGKLYEQYRPAGSPSFVASVHSNFQKDVVRKQVKDDWDWVECSE